MGLFGKIKQGVTGKEYIDNFSCPRCGGRVYVKKYLYYCIYKFYTKYYIYILNINIYKFYI